MRGITRIPIAAADEACGPPLTQVPLSESDAAVLASVLSALGDPVRLRLLSILAVHGEACSCNLEEALGRSQPTISHHTRVLAQAGLIEGEKRGKWTWWKIVPGRLAGLWRELGEMGGADPGVQARDAGRPAPGAVST